MLDGSDWQPSILCPDGLEYNPSSLDDLCQDETGARFRVRIVAEIQRHLQKTLYADFLKLEAHERPVSISAFLFFRNQSVDIMVEYIVSHFTYDAQKLLSRHSLSPYDLLELPRVSCHDTGWRVYVNPPRPLQTIRLRVPAL